MKKLRILDIISSPKFVLVIIFATFFFKGLFLVSAFPIFGGQDESRHYNTVQFLSEPKEKKWQILKQEEKQDKDDISTYRYSDEIKGASLTTNTDTLRGEIFNTIAFSSGSFGINEDFINQKPWQAINRIKGPDIVYDTQIYHQICSLIEKMFSNQSILVRFYLIRVLSVLLGMFFILISYLICKNVGFSNKHSLLITAIIAFQTKFSTYFAGINYDVLFIPMFALFTYAGILILKRGLNWKNTSLLILSVVVAILTKRTGSILLVAMIILLASQFWTNFRAANKKIQYAFYFLLAVSMVLASIYLDKYLPAKMTLKSVFDYLDKSLSIGRFALSSRTYWGTLDWTNNWFIGYVTNFIWLIQTFSFAGILLYLFGKKPLPKFLPEKNYVVFFIFMIIILQLGIRTADWSIFSQTGSLDLGTPGRYFLPNIISHLILVFTGLGTLFCHYRKEKWFDYSLLAALILMVSLTMYIIFDVVIYRFYL